MRLLVKERGRGKTTGLIYASEATGYPIVTNTWVNLEYIVCKARELGCTIPQPITIDMFKNGKVRGLRINNVLIDDAFPIIKEALNAYLGCNVECATLNYEDLVL